MSASCAVIHWGLLHHIAPDTDAAALRLRLSLGTTKHQIVSCESRLGKPEIDYLLGMPFFSSGRLLLLDFRSLPLSGICNMQGNL